MLTRYLHKFNATILKTILLSHTEIKAALTSSNTIPVNIWLAKFEPTKFIIPIKSCTVLCGLQKQKILIKIFKFTLSVIILTHLTLGYSN